MLEPSSLVIGSFSGISDWLLLVTHRPSAGSESKLDRNGFKCQKVGQSFAEFISILVRQCDCSLKKPSVDVGSDRLLRHSM